MTNDFDLPAIRSELTTLRSKYGAWTAIGRRCTNILEIDENYQKATDPEQKARLRSSMARQTADLAALCRGDRG